MSKKRRRIKNNRYDTTSLKLRVYNLIRLWRHQNSKLYKEKNWFKKTGVCCQPINEYMACKGFLTQKKPDPKCTENPKWKGFKKWSTCSLRSTKVQTGFKYRVVIRPSLFVWAVLFWKEFCFFPQNIFKFAIWFAFNSNVILVRFSLQENPEKLASHCPQECVLCFV